MPSKSEKQRRFMEIASKNKDFADKAGIPQEVAKEFHEADKKLKEENENKQKTRRDSR